MDNLGYGALMGAAIGDMVGKRLQPLGRPATSEEVKTAVSFAKFHLNDFAYDHHAHECRGCEGIHSERVDPLITPLGRLTLALGITLRNNDWHYDKKKVTSAYQRWAEKAAHHGGLDAPVADMLDKIVSGMSDYNRDATDGSALARGTPLAIMGARMAPSHDFRDWMRDREPFWDALKTDTALTHPNPLCMAASHLYVNIVRLQLANEKQVFRVEGFVRGKSDPGLKQMGIVMQWVYDSYFEGFKPQMDSNDEPVKIALQLAIYHLGAQTPFWDAVSDVASLGGDVIVNTTAVAGLLGARDGFDLVSK